MKKNILINEETLNKLIVKALPPEYEVLSQNYQLTEEEEEYFMMIMFMIDDIITYVKEWVLSLSVEDITDLDVFFFEEIHSDIIEIFKDHFIRISSLLLLFYNNGKIKSINELNEEIHNFYNEKFIINIIKHHNHKELDNLIKDTIKNLKDSIWNDIKDKVDIDEVVNNLIKNGLKAKGKFDIIQRARMIAVTERSRAYNFAKLQTYENYGITEVDVVTAGDEKVCAKCLYNESNNPYSIEDARDMLPVHPFCRCEFYAHDNRSVESIIPNIDLTNY